MKKTIKMISKVLLTVMAVAIFSSSLSSCSGIFQFEYHGKDIISIEKTSSDYMGGSTSTQTINFEQGAIYSSYYSHYMPEECYENKLEHEFDPVISDKIISAFYNAGILNLRASYRPLTPVYDGGGWTLTITYADGSKKVSQGSNAGPYLKFKKASEAFYLLTGYDALGYCGRDFKEPHNLGVSFSAFNGKKQVCSQTAYINASKYNWNNKQFSDEGMTYIPYFTFAENYEDENIYTVSLNFEGFAINYKKVGVYSYVDNINSRELVPTKKEGTFLMQNYQRRVIFDVEPNKNYIIEIEFKYGTAQYMISTAVLSEKEEYKLVEMLDVLEYNKQSEYPTQYRTIFETGVVVKDKNGLYEPNLWGDDYYIVYSYDNRLSDDVLETFNDLGFFDFSKYSYDTDNTSDVEWEVVVTYTDNSTRTYKINDPEFKVMLENVDEAFFEIVGQYIFKWIYIK